MRAVGSLKHASKHFCKHLQQNVNQQDLNMSQYAKHIHLHVSEGCLPDIYTNQCWQPDYLGNYNYFFKLGTDSSQEVYIIQLATVDTYG